MPNLAILYLHANQIEDFDAIAPIATLSRLEKLTVYGNPVEKKPHYRERTLLLGALLRELDVVAVTAEDREQAKHLQDVEVRIAAKKRSSLQKPVTHNPYGRPGHVNRTMLGRSA